jgi:hypothetical protein
MKMDKMVNLLVVLSLLIFSSCDNSNKLAERGQESSKGIAGNVTGGTGDESIGTDFMQELADFIGKSKSDIEKFLEDSNLDLTAEDERKVEEIKEQIKDLKDIEEQINSVMSGNKEGILFLLNFNELCEKYDVVLEGNDNSIFARLAKKFKDIIKEICGNIRKLMKKIY